MIFRRVKPWYFMVIGLIMGIVLSWASFHAGRAVGHLDNIYLREDVYRETNRLWQAIYRCDELWQSNEEGKL